MSSFTNGFHHAQDCIVRLNDVLFSMRAIALADSLGKSEDLRFAGTMALQDINYATERVASAVKSLRGHNKRRVVISTDDYERFIERAFTVAQSFGVPSDQVAGSLVSEALLALRHAGDAIEHARSFYTDTGKTLVC